jgi:N-acetylglucosamine malate deacetylase 1
VDIITRRRLLASGGSLAGASLIGLPQPPTKQKVVVVGAHPDDPESGCGGTIAHYSSLGHEVVIVYLTAGETGIPGTPPSEAAAIRSAEARKACDILEARPVFAGQINGDTGVSNEQYRSFAQILEAEKPALLLTQWPIDSHRDHRVASLLTYDYWLRSGKRASLFYYEVETGEQTQNFKPTHYIDITQTEDRKREACFVHVSQKPGTTFYPTHERMQKFRGMECGCGVAEAFICHDQSAFLHSQM